MASLHLSVWLLCATLVEYTIAFSLYPSVNSDVLASALNISIGCLDALNTTLDCDDYLFQWTVTVDDHWWSEDNLTALCTSECSSEAQSWENDVSLACLEDDLTVYGKSVPAYTVAGRFVDGLGLACLQSDTNDWCMAESLTWVGSDVVRPDCNVNPSDPSCSNPANVTAENQRMANLYSDDLLCSDCFVKMLHLRLSSDYLPDSDYSDYLVEQFQDVQDVCSTTLADLSTRALTPYPTADIAVANASTTVSTTTTEMSTTSTTPTTSASTAPSPTQSGIVSNCDSYYQAVSGDGCFAIASDHNITLDDFDLWNPAVGSDCSGLFAGYWYCIGVTLDSSSSSCQMANTSIGVTSSDATVACEQLSLLLGVATGSLIQYTGAQDCYSENNVCLPPACNLTQVPAGATCASIAASLSANSSIGTITTTQLLSWNPNIIGTCDNLTESQYICIHAPGGSYVPPPNPTTTANAGGQERGGPGGADPTAVTGTSVSFIVTTQPLDSNPTAAPAPTQEGIVSNCNQYDQVESGDTCTSFATSNGISTDELYQFNTQLGENGADCSTMLWAGYYYCIGVSNAATTTTSTPISTATPVAPTPTQSGIVSDCDLWAQAQSGDYCSKFAADHEITTTELYEWNTHLGTDGANCDSDFWAGYYYCIGISPPSPTQSGIPSNCNDWAEAVSGDYCSEFADAHSITTTELYEWNPVLGSSGENCDTQFFAGYYYCISTS